MDIGLNPLLKRFANRILEAVPGDVVIHLFTDEDTFQEFQSLPNLVGPDATRGIRLYDPAMADYKIPPRSSTLNATAEITNPWLAWMADSLKGITIDGVHFVCHGFLSVCEGAVALAQSPKRNSDRAWARFVGANQLDALLRQVGAWSLGLSSPPGNYSVLGLRCLHYQMAELRTGATLLHEIAHDNDLTGLEQAYRYLYSNEPSTPPASGAVSLYCHPQQVETSTPVLESLFELRAPKAASKGLGPVGHINMSERETSRSAWVTSSTIGLEQVAAELVETAPTSEWQSATDAGVKEALNFVSDIVRRHARTTREK
jgi:hypothetical protein